jgi:hypothetical protein
MIAKDSDPVSDRLHELSREEHSIGRCRSSTSRDPSQSGGHQLGPKLPKLAGFLEEAEIDVLAYMTFPPPHGTKLHSTNDRAPQR